MIERIENRLVEGIVKGFGKKNVFYLDNGIFAISIPKMKEDAAGSIYEKLRDICVGVGSLLPLEPYVSVLRKEDIETGEDCLTAADMFKSHIPGADSGKRVFELKIQDFRLHRRERAVLTAITEGLADNHFVVCYQPIYDVSIDTYS